MHTIVVDVRARRAAAAARAAKRRTRSRRTPPRSHGAFTQVLDPRIRLHFEYFQSILENLSRGDRLADAQNRADRIVDACRKAATRGVPRKSLDLSVEFPSARRLWRVAPSDGTGLAMMAHGSILCRNGDHPSWQDQKGDNSPK